MFFVCTNREFFRWAQHDNPEPWVMLLYYSKLSISNLKMKNETLISQFTQLGFFFHIIVLETVEQNGWDEKFLR